MIKSGDIELPVLEGSSPSGPILFASFFFFSVNCIYLDF